MTAHLEPSQFVDIEQPGSFGPLFDHVNLHLGECQACRRAWLECQALKAMALEAGLQPEPRLKRKALQNARKVEVEERLSAQAGPDAARAILLERRSAAPQRPSLAPLLVALLALVGLAGIYAYSRRSVAPSEAASTPLPFEFQQSPVTAAPAALSPGAEAATEIPTPSLEPREKAEDQELENEARRMLLAHLKKEPKAKRRRTETAAADEKETAPTMLPTAAPTALPSPPPTAVPSPLPTALPSATPQPSPLPTTVPTENGDSVNLKPAPDLPDASLVVQTPRFAPSRSESARLQLTLPEEGPIEIRVFDAQGKSVKLIADGKYGPGKAEFRFAGKNEDGEALPAGTYYARVMTRWFSRVEPLDLIP